MPVKRKSQALRDKTGDSATRGCNYKVMLEYNPKMTQEEAENNRNKLFSTIANLGAVLHIKDLIQVTVVILILLAIPLTIEYRNSASVKGSAVEIISEIKSASAVTTGNIETKAANAKEYKDDVKAANIETKGTIDEVKDTNLGVKESKAEVSGEKAGVKEVNVDKKEGSTVIKQDDPNVKQNSSNVNENIPEVKQNLAELKLSPAATDKYLKDNNYEIIEKCDAAAIIQLPISFNTEKDGIKVGEMLKDRNERSKLEASLDFSKYLGKSVYMFTARVKMGSSEEKNIVVLACGDKVIGQWTDPKAWDYNYLNGNLGEKISNTAGAQQKDIVVKGK